MVNKALFCLMLCDKKAKLKINKRVTIFIVPVYLWRDRSARHRHYPLHKSFMSYHFKGSG